MNTHSIIWLVVYTLLIFGGLNGSRVGVLVIDVVARLLGSVSIGAKIVDMLTDIAGILMLVR
ncbi:MAG: hypothetical protein H0X26_03435 [Alphaproteobacteria bacterium]|nr:hypothetical protein [Alphaproteobacteria bacterium]